MKISEKKYIPLFAVVGFIFFQVLMHLSGISSFMNVIASFHLFIVPLSFVLFFTLQKTTKYILFISIIYYQIIMVSALYLLYVYYFGDPLGYNPMDALYYHEVATIIKDMSFYDLFPFLVLNHDIGDVGFLYLVSLIYKIPGPYPIFTVKLFNIFFHLLTCFYLYKLSFLIFNNKRISTVALLLCGLNPASVFFNASGLKEPIFALIVTVSFYLIYKAYLTNNIWFYIVGGIFIMSTGLFRVAFPVFIVLSFTIYFFFNTKGVYKLYKQGLIVLMSLIGLYLGFKIVEIELLNKINYNVIAIASNRLGSTPGLVDYFILTVGGLIGPFPSFNYSEFNYVNLLQTPGDYFKIIMSFFFLVGVYLLYGKRMKIVYPLFLFIAMNGVVLIGLAASLDYRFVYPYIALYFIILSYGYVYRNKMKKNIVVNEINYYVTIIILVIIYNIR